MALNRALYEDYMKEGGRLELENAVYEDLRITIYLRFDCVKIHFLFLTSSYIA